MPRYSSDFKESIVQKVTSPGAISINQMAVKMGLSPSSISYWVRAYAKTPRMKKSLEWTPEAKLKSIIETSSMNENQLGEYLRANGLHSADLERWKQDFYNSQKAPGRPKLDPELADLRNKEKELSKDLKRKERALAEMTARVVLLKKSRLIWGDGEDEE